MRSTRLWLLLLTPNLILSNGEGQQAHDGYEAADSDQKIEYSLHINAIHGKGPANGEIQDIATTNHGAQDRLLGSMGPMQDIRTATSAMEGTIMVMNHFKQLAAFNEWANACYMPQPLIFRNEPTGCTEPGLKVGKPNVVAPLVGIHDDVMSAMRTVDQGPARAAARAHFTESYLLFAWHGAEVCATVEPAQEQLSQSPA